MNKLSDGETFKDFADLIKFLEERAEEYPYLDDLPILIVEECTRPFIVMGPNHFKEQEKRVVGDV